MQANGGEYNEDWWKISSGYLWRTIAYRVLNTNSRALPLLSLHLCHRLDVFFFFLLNIF